ncbi:ankyrin repeat domain-containing protein [Alteromonas stellipolaris]|uniref:ankyrin repeat domain-containing protein n=1 Tax=Alteromonas stellipolaris TaxID=233316 RepID=UPI0027346A4D|nr:ankyrin repeat domain-containing protein [Alteromonas stellipolaris]MDP2596395.1 ankyrin repeat domain-containing protein [Alteromonas stellipolaris]
MSSLVKRILFSSLFFGLFICLPLHAAPQSRSNISHTILNCDMKEYLQAAVALDSGLLDFGKAKLQTLNDDKCEPAGILFTHLEKAAKAKERTQALDTELTKVLHSRWGESAFIAGPTMLYNTLMISLMIFPDEANKEIADYITSYLTNLPVTTFDRNMTEQEYMEMLMADSYKDFIPVLSNAAASPPLLFEASRRYSYADPEKGMYWYVVGLTKLSFLIESAGGFGGGMGDILSVWRAYASQYLSKSIPSQYEFTEAYIQGTQSVLENWDDAMGDLDKLISADTQEGKSSKEILASLKTKLTESVNSHNKKTEKEKLEEVSLFGLEADALLQNMREAGFSNFDDIEEGFLTSTSKKYEPKSNRRVTPLMFAVVEQDPTLLLNLLKAGADPNYKPTSYGESPITLAAEFADSSILALLLENGGNPNSFGRVGMTAIAIAIIADRWDNMKTLVEKGANVNLFDDLSNRSVPLIMLAEDGHYKEALYLIEKGADVKKVEQGGNTIGHVLEKAQSDSEYLTKLKQVLADNNIVLPLPETPNDIGCVGFNRSLSKCKSYIEEVEQYNKVIEERFGPEGKLEVEAHILKWLEKDEAEK